MYKNSQDLVDQLILYTCNSNAFVFSSFSLYSQLSPAVIFNFHSFTIWRLKQILSTINAFQVTNKTL